MRRPGSHTSSVAVPSHSGPQESHTLPPTFGSTFAWKENQRSTSAPSLSAFHTASGGASIISSRSILRSVTGAVLIVVTGDLRVGAQEQPVRPPAGRVLVVVLRGQLRHRGGQLLGEGPPGLRRGEADLGLEAQGGELLAGARGAPDEHGHVPDRAGGDRHEVGGREAVRRLGRV